VDIIVKGTIKGRFGPTSKVTTDGGEAMVCI